MVVSVFAYDSSYKNLKKLEQLQEEKEALINNYEIRLEVARIDRMYKRVDVLSKTLSCLKDSRSKRDLMNCKTKERKRIMSMIRKKS